MGSMRRSNRVRQLPLACVLTVLVLTGCNGSNEGGAKQSVSTAPHGLDCPHGEVKGVSFDLGEDPATKNSPDAALNAFLRQEEKIRLHAVDFLRVKPSRSRAEFAYESGSQRLGTVYVTRLKEGWIVGGYELCPEAFSNPRAT